MSQQPKKPTLIRRRFITEPRPPSPKPTSPELQTLYSQTQQFLESFDTEIKKCKRFNETKVYRKYEVVMKDLEIQNQRLTSKLQREVNMRCPTKEYVEGLLGCIVELRGRVEDLKVRVAELEGEIKRKQDEIQKQRKGIILQDKIIRFQVDKHLPHQEHIHINCNFDQIMKRFIQTRISNSCKFSLPVPKFVKFLKSAKATTLQDLLQKTSIWTQQIMSPRSNKASDQWQPKYIVENTIAKNNLRTKRRLSTIMVQNRRGGLKTQPASIETKGPDIM